MMHRFIVPLFAIVASTGIAMADEVKSGPAIGDTTTAFNVKDITGPNAGTSLCYRCQYGARPVACVFTREITPEVANLIANLDKQVGENKAKDMAGFVVLLTDDADAGAKKLTKLKEEKGIKNVPLTVFDGNAGPEKYQIAKDAAVTVLMWTKGHFTVSHGFATPKLSDDQVKTVASDTSKILK
jgi:hypothetical protein